VTARCNEPVAVAVVAVTEWRSVSGTVRVSEPSPVRGKDSTEPSVELGRGWVGTLHGIAMACVGIDDGLDGATASSPGPKSRGRHQP
jgi:hypothetical protein